MKRFTHRCSHGATTLTASTVKGLQDKIDAHELIAHGPYPLAVCGPRPYVRGTPLAADSRRPFALGRRS